jgi:mono/diheme cytochrome c family protein
LQAAATDGYVSELPMDLVKRGASGGAVAWIAIEPTNKPWPKIPKKDISAGPFYLVRQFPKRSNITPGQWPYALGTLKSTRSPMQRWPQLAVPSSLGDDAPERRGMHVFIKHCLACHRLNTAGESDVGPDIMKPMPATDYMTEKGLRALIRDPASVRSWPQQQMTGFAKEVLADRALDDLISYLKVQASAAK